MTAGDGKFQTNAYQAKTIVGTSNCRRVRLTPELRMRFAKMSRLQVANLIVEIKADKKVGQLRGMNDYRADGTLVERHAED